METCVTRYQSEASLCNKRQPRLLRVDTGVYEDRLRGGQVAQSPDGVRYGRKLPRSGARLTDDEGPARGDQRRRASSESAEGECRGKKELAEHSERSSQTECRRSREEAGQRASRRGAVRGMNGPAFRTEAKQASTKQEL